MAPQQWAYPRAFRTVELDIDLACDIIQTGRLYQDRGVRMTVACERERLDEARRLVLEIGRQLGQEAKWFEVRGYDGVQILAVE